MLGLKPFDRLVNELSHLPGVGSKTAARLAYFILKSPHTYAENLAESLAHLKKSLKKCPECFNYMEVGDGVCSICKNPKRNHQMICLVEEPMDIVRLEDSNFFHGLYHVLHGVISPLEGIRPEDLHIKELIDRVKRFSKIEKNLEIIFAFDADLEGDTTLLYLTKILRENVWETGSTIKMSRLAHGMPMGADIDYVDERTIAKALENRLEME